jgi:hypothetical protein
MTATVLITFERDSEAAAFVRTLYSQEPTYTEIGAAVFPGDVDAVIRRPTEWCTCAGQGYEGGTRRRRSRPKKEQGYTKDKNGWFVCVHCGKPSRALVVHFVSSMLVGMTDFLPKILGQGDPRTLFEQRVMEVVEAAIAEGIEADLESLTAHERQFVKDNPNGVADMRFGNTALNGGGVSRRSTKARRQAHPRRGND